MAGSDFLVVRSALFPELRHEITLLRALRAFSMLSGCFAILGTEHAAQVGGITKTDHARDLLQRILGLLEQRLRTAKSQIAQELHGRRAIRSAKQPIEIRRMKPSPTRQLLPRELSPR